MWFSLAFDGVLVILLGVTIFYCYLVNKRLDALRSGKDELKQVIEDLTVATTRAQMSISHLKQAGQEIVGTLEDDVRNGRTLADELSLMIEAGNNLADRLEGGRARAASDRAASDRAAEITPDLMDLKNLSHANESLQSQVRPSTSTASQAGLRVGRSVDERPSVKSTPKPQNVEGTIENELLKALRRAR